MANPSPHIEEGVHFLGGKEKYLVRCYSGNPGKFDVDWGLVYPGNEWIVNIFNGGEIHGWYGLEIKQEAQKLRLNPKDWELIKHLVFKKEYIWLYGQVALYSPKLDILKCYEYRYKAEYEPPDYHDMVDFEEIPRKKFKMKSALRLCEKKKIKEAPPEEAKALIISDPSVLFFEDIAPLCSKPLRRMADYEDKSPR